MRFSIAEPSQLVCAALLTSSSLTTAFPWSYDHHNSKHLDSVQNSQKASGISEQLAWLRVASIEAIFGPSKPEIKRPCTKASKSSTPAHFRTRYDKDIVLRFNMSTAEEVSALQQAASTLVLDVWASTPTWADIRLASSDLPSLLGLLPKSLQDSYAPLMDSLGDIVYATYPGRDADGSKAKHTYTDLTTQAQEGNNIFFQDYQPLSVLVPWMKLMASMFTTHVTLVNIGKSSEGREIPALRIGVRPSPPPSLTDPPVGRKTIIINGGSHAREWIGTSSVTYVAWHLISEYGKNGQITKLLHEFDWVFIPTLNPDGYVYSWDTDRLWRKNRQETCLKYCKGIDLDRNFGYKFDGSPSASQSNPCSESYPGEEAFEAVEARALSDWAENEEANNNVTFIGFLDLHSYSQQVLYPWSYTCDVEPPTLENLEELGIGIAKAIRISSGEEYTVQSACEGNVEFPSPSSTKSKRSDFKKSDGSIGGGSALDWMYGTLHAKYSYQIKLRDNGAYGFLLPSEMIVPVGEEVVDAVKYFGSWVLGNKGIEGISSVENEGENGGEDWEIVDEAGVKGWDKQAIVEEL